LNLEIAYCMPPLGLNLFISSFRFNRPVSSLYKIVMPFVGILAVGLLLVSYIPWFSTVAVAGDVAAVRAKAQKDGVPPRDAWMMECVQEDPNNPMPCSPADRAAYPGGQPASAQPGVAAEVPSGDTLDTSPDAGCNPDFEDCSDAGAVRR
jgi:C4-dicarboxylate transporter DctM subunit